MLDLDRQPSIFLWEEIFYLALFKLLWITSSHIISFWCWLYELERKDTNQEVGKPTSIIVETETQIKELDRDVSKQYSEKWVSEKS